MAKFYRWLMRLLLLIIIPVIIAASVSYSLWGYAFAPPSIDQLAGGMAINSLSYIEFVPEGDVALPENAVPNEMMYRYYEPPSHIDDYARRRGVINLTPSDEDLLTAVNQAILTLGWELYPDDVSLIGGEGRQPGGFVVVGEQYDTSKLVLVGLGSARLDLIHYDPNSSGDSYRAYEALFELRPDGGLRLINQQSYRFDSAGIEFCSFRSS